MLKKYPFSLYVTILVVGESVLAFLLWNSGEWFFAGSRETFGPLNTYIFIWLSIIIASIAALSSSFSAIATRDSLELARASFELMQDSIRPYVAIKDISIIWSSLNKRTLTLNYLMISIKNYGSVPGINVSVDIEIWREADATQRKLLRFLENCSPMSFPNEEVINLKCEAFSDETKLEVNHKEKLCLKTTVTYLSVLNHKTYHTWRDYELVDPSKGNQPVALPFTI